MKLNVYHYPGQIETHGVNWEVILAMFLHNIWIFFICFSRNKTTKLVSKFELLYLKTAVYRRLSCRKFNNTFKSSLYGLFLAKYIGVCLNSTPQYGSKNRDWAFSVWWFKYYLALNLMVRWIVSGGNFCSDIPFFGDGFIKF